MFDPGDDADEQDGDAPASASAKPSTGIRATMRLEVNISSRIPHAEGVVRPGVVARPSAAG